MSHSDSPSHEKEAYLHEEQAGVAYVEKGAAAGETHYDPVFLKKTIAKIDRRLLLILGALYSVSLIDRTK